jgi:hypothetical protein
MPAAAKRSAYAGSVSSRVAEKPWAMTTHGAGPATPSGR